MKLNIGAILLIITALWLTACSSDSNTNTAPIGDGREAYLSMEVYLQGGSAVTLVAADEEALAELMKAQMTNDERGLAELRLRGRVLAVPNGTRARVIERNRFGATRLSILEGEFIDRAVWAGESWFSSRQIATETTTPTSANNSAPPVPRISPLPGFAPPAASPRPSPSPTPLRAPTPEAGQTGRLYVAGVNRIPVALTPDDFWEAQDALFMNDEYEKALRLLYRGRLFMVENHSPVVVLEYEGYLTRIRLRRGGRVGWVKTAWILFDY